jgi:hypothetical protein
MTALICGSMAYDTVMVFEGRFREHIPRALDAPEFRRLRRQHRL